MSFEKRQGLCSALLSLALLTPLVSNAQSSDNVMLIAVAFGPKSEVPDSRVKQNGWLSNRAGVSETLIGLDTKMQQFPRLASYLYFYYWLLSLRLMIRIRLIFITA